MTVPLAAASAHAAPMDTVARDRQLNSSLALHSTSSSIGDVSSDPTSAWFNPARFESLDFSPHEYVSEMRRVVPLERLRAELQRHLAKLREDLVEVINEDYAQFMGLSGDLSAVGGSVIRLKAPLLQLKESLLTVQDRYQAELKSLQDCLDRKSEIANAKAMLELMQDASGVTAKVETLAQDLPSAEKLQTAADAVAYSQLMARIASEASRLIFYLAKGQDVPIVAALKPRLDAVLARLQAAVATSLERTLPSAAPEHDAASALYLHVTSLVGDLALANAAVRAHMIAPALAAALEGASGAPDPLAAFLAAAQAALAAPLARLLAMPAAHPDLLAVFEPLGECVLAQVHASIAAELPAAFSAGAPTTFHANYTACMRFVAWLEAQAPSVAAVYAFREGPAHAAFTKAWNLSVYMSLRFQEIAGEFEKNLVHGPTPCRSGPAARCSFSQTEELFQLMARCRQPDVYLAPLSDRFVKLQLQLILRYGTWLRQAEGALSALAVGPDGGAPAGTAAPENPEFSGFDVGSMRQWATKASPEDLATALADACAAERAVRDDVVPGVAALLSPSPSLVTRLEEAFGAAVATVIECTQPLQRMLVGRLLEGAQTWLRHVKGISAMYRMTARAPPTKASHYVASLLKQAQTLKDSQVFGSLEPALAHSVMLAVANAIMDAFHTAAAELLDTVEKTQASLSKLGRGRQARPGTDGAGAGAGGAELSDVEKIQKQLWLDVLDFGRHLEKLLGQPAAQSAAFQRLLGLVPQPTPLGGQ